MQTDGGTGTKENKRKGIPNKVFMSSEDEIVPNKKLKLTSKKSVVRKLLVTESSSDEDRPSSSNFATLSDNEIHSSMVKNMFDALLKPFKDVEVSSSSSSKSSRPSTDLNATELPAATFSLDQPSTSHGNGILPSTCSNCNIDTIAWLLIQLNDRMTNVENIQREILERLTQAHLKNTHPLAPIDITLPCGTVQEVEDLDTWLANEDNVLTLTKHLSLVGGKKPANVTRRILERLFTNQVAAQYNWTGKNQKLSLKDLVIMKLLPGFVRKNIGMEAVSDDEVYSTSSQWFRFTKDREGGREKRRSNARPSLV
ncbi:uncharacterized protein LOC128983647 [Macrosteles quadrilineatus]|uniref:uncharacterized protein LOC128983647 n=1 Tax=Macrosteles quadrilineatus TaxID=74068 RepID=UPI0023E298D7|nr:uncharacterized protein LOC128983647 [Macrosteles quadrilineatus]